MSDMIFTNEGQNSLFERLSNLLTKNGDSLKNFKIVVGFLRSTGFFSLYARIPEHIKIKIIVGIKADDTIAKLLNNNEDFNLSRELNKLDYQRETELAYQSFRKRFENGTLEIRIHKRRKLHSKFYLLFQEDILKENLAQTVIIGSSNLTNQGLGIAKESNFEMNVQLNNYQEISFANDQFEKLWHESEPLKLQEELINIKKNVYLEYNPTPYEVYIKFLIENRGYLVDYESIEIEGIQKIKYQDDAATEGFEMLKNHNGFFLADVVGTGKTIIALLICVKFIIENGNTTKILIVLPKATEAAWLTLINKITFNNKTIKDYITIIAKDQLAKLGSDNYDRPERFDLVVVDEAHNFRSSNTKKYKKLMSIMASQRSFLGNLPGKKRLVLMTATPFNNNHQDIKNLVYLFQDPQNNTIINQNLDNYFKVIENRINKAKKKNLKERNLINQRIANSLKKHIVEDITVRRTRAELKKNYSEDLDKLRFPEVGDPLVINYELDDNLQSLYRDTIDFIDEKFKYALYNDEKYKKTESELVKSDFKFNSLSGLMRTLLFKRLESSQAAFKETLMKIKDNYDTRTIELSDIMEEEDLENNFNNQGFQSLISDKEFFDHFNEDKKNLEELIRRWSADNIKDKKLNRLKEALLKLKKVNPMAKIIVFSEYTATINYIKRNITDARIFASHEIILVDSKNLKNSYNDIRANFDNSIDNIDKKDNKRVLITTDILSEGVNLHRAGIVINYDTPWNPIKLVQRIGRICRLGSPHEKLLNYIFYPSESGEEIINLINKAQEKISFSNEIYGSDHKILSPNELVKEFGKDFSGVEESDQKSESLMVLRKLKRENPEEYNRIQGMPNKIRCVRRVAKDEITGTIAFLKTGNSNQSYKMDINNKLKKLSFKEAEKYFRAEKDEVGDSNLPSYHFDNINTCLEKFKEIDTINADVILSESFTSAGTFAVDDEDEEMDDPQPTYNTDRKSNKEVGGSQLNFLDSLTS